LIFRRIDISKYFTVSRCTVTVKLEDNVMPASQIDEGRDDAPRIHTGFS